MQLRVPAPVLSGTNEVYNSWDAGTWCFRAGSYPGLNGVGNGCATDEPIVETPPSPFADGTGSEMTPYQITTLAELDSIRDNSGNGGQNYLDDHFILMNNLDFSGYTYSADNTENAKGWLPIGHDTNPNTGNHQGTSLYG